MAARILFTLRLKEVAVKDTKATDAQSIETQRVDYRVKSCRENELAAWALAL